MNRPLISVIVPVYNVERYLSACIDSIINQSYDALEIIVVDDGSTDNSGEICRRYADSDKRVFLKKQKNGGLSAARNAGLELASGEFIAFVDSDDILHNRCIDTLYALISEHNADIASVEFLPFFDRKIPQISNLANADTHVLNSDDAIEKILYQNILNNSAWGKLFRKELFRTIRFPEGKIYEDLASCYKLIEQSKKVVHKRIPLYFYRLRSESITGNFSLRRTDVLDITDEIVEYMYTSHPTLLPAARDRKFAANMNILWLMTRSNIYSLEVEKRCWRNIKMLRTEILLNPKSRLKNRVGALTSLLGLSFLKFMFNLKKPSR